MKKVKRLCLAVLLLGGAMTTEAQGNKIETTVEADIVSQYVWRGQDLGDVSLQPTLGLGYKGLSLTAWGSVGLTDPDDTKEFDLTLVGYDFGPLALQWYTNFAGNDGVTKSGKRAYSSYFELSAPFKLASVDWTAALGAVPYATSFYERVDGFAVTNVSLTATKDIKITDSFSIPLFAQVAANPCSQKAYLVLGLKLRP